MLVVESFVINYFVVVGWLDDAWVVVMVLDAWMGDGYGMGWGMRDLVVVVCEVLHALVVAQGVVYWF